MLDPAVNQVATQRSSLCNNIVKKENASQPVLAFIFSHILKGKTTPCNSEFGMDSYYCAIQSLSFFLELTC